MDQVDAMVQANVHKLSEGAREAIIACSSAFRFGCNWGFFMEKAGDLRKKLELFQGEQNFVAVDQASNAVIFTCNKDWLMEQVNLLLPGALQQSFVEESKARAQKELERFSRLIIRLCNGKLDNFDGILTIAVYSMNEEGYLVLKGNRYHAFRLSLVEVLKCLDLLIRENESKGSQANPRVTSLANDLSFRAVGTDGRDGFIPLKDILSGKNNLVDILRGIYVVTHGTGALLQLAYKA